MTLRGRDVKGVRHTGTGIGAELGRTNENVFTQRDAIELGKQVLVMIMQSIVLIAQGLDQALHDHQRRDTKQLIRRFGQTLANRNAQNLKSMTRESLITPFST